MMFFPRKLLEFFLADDCFVKLVIYCKTLPQERFSDLFMLGQNSFIPFADEIYETRSRIVVKIGLAYAL